MGATSRRCSDYTSRTLVTRSTRVSSKRPRLGCWSCPTFPRKGWRSSGFPSDPGSGFCRKPRFLTTWTDKTTMFTSYSDPTSSEIQNKQKLGLNKKKKKIVFKKKKKKKKKKKS